MRISVSACLLVAVTGTVVGQSPTTTSLSPIFPSGQGGDLCNPILGSFAGSEIYQGFGTHVSTEDGVAVVSVAAYSRDDGADPSTIYTGSFFVYAFDNGLWDIVESVTGEAMLTDFDGRFHRIFYLANDVSEDTIVVRRFSQDYARVIDEFGIAAADQRDESELLVFRHDNGEWLGEPQVISQPNGVSPQFDLAYNPDQLFGYSVKVSGDWLAATDSYRDISDTRVNAVHLYQFSSTSDTWTYVQTIAETATPFGGSNHWRIELDGTPGDEALIVYDVRDDEVGVYSLDTAGMIPEWVLETSFAGATGTGLTVGGYSGDVGFDGNTIVLARRQSGSGSGGLAIHEGLLGGTWNRQTATSGDFNTSMVDVVDIEHDRILFAGRVGSSGGYQIFDYTPGSGGPADFDLVDSCSGSPMSSCHVTGMASLGGGDSSSGIDGINVGAIAPHAAALDGSRALVADPDFDPDTTNIDCARGRVFSFVYACSAADLGMPFGQLDGADAVAFLQLYGAQDPAADLAAPFGTWDNSDYIVFLQLFGAGCP